MTADINKTNLLSYITSAEWGSPEFRWSGTLEDFIIAFDHKMTEYGGFAEIDDNFKITMMQKAVRHHPQLSNIYTTSRVVAVPNPAPSVIPCCTTNTSNC